MSLPGATLAIYAITSGYLQAIVTVFASGRWDVNLPEY
jgi:hypothetical protein